MKKVHRAIKFNPKTWPYINMNTDLRKKAKNDFEKDFFQLTYNTVFRETMGNVRKHGNIKLVTTEWKINYLVSASSYQTTKLFTEHLLAIAKKKKGILMNELAYIGLSIPELSTLLMYEFWYYYLKPKYGENLRLCFMDTGSFIVYIKTDDIYKNIAEDVETRFDISNYELDKPLPKKKNKKVIWLMEDELGEKIMIKFVELRAKTYNYLTDDGSEDKKVKCTKWCVIKRKLKIWKL